MVLPKIEKRKLSDLMTKDAKNPFMIEDTSEKLMVMREKQREIEKLDSIKKKIEHKYLHGLPLMHTLAVKKPRNGTERQFSMDRHGMVREIDSIKALKIPAQVHHSFNSAAERAGFPRHKSLAMDSNRLVRTLQAAEMKGTIQSEVSPRSTMTVDNSMSSIRKGNARFKTPAPRQLGILDDPLRYLKKTTSRNESIYDYIDSSRKILKVNVNLMENQEDVDKLKTMISDEESKLAKAKAAFKEDS